MDRLTIYTPDGYESINPVDLELDEYSDINFERIVDKLGKYEDIEEKIEDRIKSIKSSSDYPHNFKGQMVEDLEWVLNQLI